MDFFEQIPLLSDFNEIANPAKMVKVPTTWFVLLADIEDSTTAIKEGKYREVNLVGAASIIALLNGTGEKRIPYIFGGDGATFLVPGPLMEKATEALKATQNMAKGSFGLHLRIGRVSISELEGRNLDVRVGRYQMSANLTQAAIGGNGLIAAELLVKGPTANNRYLIGEIGETEPGNFEGLECRWEPIPSKRGEIVSLLVQSLYEDPKKATECYHTVIQQIEKIYDNKKTAPISKDGMRISKKLTLYRKEGQLRFSRTNAFKRFVAIAKSYLITRLFIFLWNNLLKKMGDRYFQEVIENTDFKKFDGTLRMVLDGTVGQRETLQKYLEKTALEGKIVYGHHSSDHALMTCLIFDRLKGNHIHFIDGDNGGYAEASKQLKLSLKTNQSRQPKSA